MEISKNNINLDINKERDVLRILSFFGKDSPLNVCADISEK